MAITLILPTQALVLHAYAVLTGSTPGNAAFKEHQAFINTAGVGAAGYKAALESFASNISTASLATTMLANLGLSTAFTQAQAVAFLNANPGNRVGAMMDLASQLYNYNGTDATLLTAKAAYVTSVDGSYLYSNNTANINGQAFVGTGAQTVSLTTGLDNLVGSAVNDTFIATTVNGANTFQDGDKIDGGAGVDTVYLDFVSVGNAITPNLKNVETVVIRAQSASVDANGVNANDGNNMPINRTVQIDAQRSLATDAANKVTADIGVTQWESSNSRSDVVIEDVRIGNAQKTKDITIAFRESDPGNVDLGVYFDQHSLRNAGTGQTSLTINLMDSGAAAVAATAATPLLNNPYDLFKLGINGVLSSLQLDKVAVAAADTYEALLAVFNTALTGTGITAELSGTFTIVDPLSTATVTGKSIVLKAGPGVTITAPAGSGWFNTTGASVPASSNIYTTYTTGATSTTELVTSKIILDDVGRGSTGGDLVVGGMSVGDTSTSRGVERFEISVEDSSKLQTINSTNNALREVVIVNGTTSNTSSAYNTVVTNAGDLTVRGKVTNSDATLPGAETGSPVADHDSVFGFSDVRLIDGSAMTGKLNFTSQITTDSLAKYVNLVDTANSPTADVTSAGNVNFNVKGANFAYSGGANDDTMEVTIDSSVAASTTLTGQSDFTIVINGGTGNDAITTSIGGLQTAAWNADQKRNANITIDGGAGDDTITTSGAGAVIITAGTGNDTVYTDNTGNKATWAVNDLFPALTSDLFTAGAGGAGFLFGGKLTVSLSGAAVGGAVMAGVADSSAGTTADPYSNGLEVKVDIPTGTNYVVSQFYINQAIKKAINDDAVLSKLLLASDGPSNTLTITSKIDGAFVAGDLKMSITATDLTTLSTADQATALAAYKIVSANSAAVIATAQTANALTVTTGNGVAGMDVNQVLGASTITNLQFAVAVTVPGTLAVTESAVATLGALTAGQTLTYAGITLTAGGTGATAAQVAGAFASLAAGAAANANAAYAAAGTLTGYNTGAAAGTAVTFTSTVASSNVADLALAGTGAAASSQVITQGSALTAEQFTVTVTGTASAGETITFDGTTSGAFLAADTAATVAAGIVGAAGGTYGAGVAVGNVVTFTATAAGVTADAVAADFTSNANVLLTGSISTAESDNTIDLGAGNDVLVLGTGANSNDTIVFTGTDIGKNTIVNFADAAGTNADVLNFKSYLVDKASASGSVDSQVRIATTLNGDATVEANSVTVITTAVFTTTDTFAGLTGAKLLTAINTTGNVAFAGIADATLNATNTYIGSGASTTLVGGVGHSVVMVQNNANQGEYAVFELTFNGLATNLTNAFTSATLLGTVDFGNSIDGLVQANLA